MKCVRSVYVELQLARPNQRGSRSFPVTPQSSKINLQALLAFSLSHTSTSSWLQWEASLHKLSFQMLYGAQIDNQPQS